MTTLLFLKTFNNDYLIQCVKLIEKYMDTHINTNIRVEVYDKGLYVYDRQVLLLNIHVNL